MHGQRALARRWCTLKVHSRVQGQSLRPTVGASGRPKREPDGAQRLGTAHAAGGGAQSGVTGGCRRGQCGGARDGDGAGRSDRGGLFGSGVSREGPSVASWSWGGEGEQDTRGSLLSGWGVASGAAGVVLTAPGHRARADVVRWKVDRSRLQGASGRVADGVDAAGAEGCARRRAPRRSFGLSAYCAFSRMPLSDHCSRPLSEAGVVRDAASDGFVSTLPRRLQAALLLCMLTSWVQQPALVTDSPAAPQPWLLVRHRSCGAAGQALHERARANRFLGECTWNVCRCGSIQCDRGAA